MLLPPINRRSQSEVQDQEMRTFQGREEEKWDEGEQFRTMDSNRAFMTLHRRNPNSSKLETYRNQQSLRSMRSTSLETLITKCQESIRPENKLFKSQLLESQERIQKMLNDLVRRPKELRSYAAVKSRRKFLQDQEYISHSNVRKMIMDNRLQFKRARVMAIEN